MWAHQLKPLEYLQLMDRGWRRSGKYCYKPILSKICCPPYTIRCDVAEFTITKTQKKVIKRFNSFLKTGKVPGSSSLKQPSSRQTTTSSSKVECEDVPQEASVSCQENPMECEDTYSMNTEMTETSTDTLSIRTDDTEMTSLTATESRCSSNDKSSLHDKQSIRTGSAKSSVVNSTASDHSHASGDKPSLRTFSVTESKATTIEPLVKKKLRPVIETTNKDGLPLKAKIIRIKRRIAMVSLKRNMSLEVAKEVVFREHNDKVSKRRINSEPKSLEELMKLDDSLLNKHRLEIRFVSSSFVNQNDEAQEVFNESNLDIEHSIYEKYQKMVHNDEPDECNKKQFTRFLVDSPLMSTPFKGSLLNYSQSHAKLTAFGSYHMQYWLNGVTLIAVGVIDILPRGLSSVYLFYDPSYSFLSLGTYTALQEVLLTREILRSYLPFKDYYMGFYIDSCPKMKYKAKIQPSYLLCPEAKTWHPTIECLDLLKKNKYSRLNPDEGVVDEDSRGIHDEDIGVFFSGRGIGNFAVYLSLKSDDLFSRSTSRKHKSNKSSQEKSLSSTEEQVREYASLVGKKTAKSLLLFLE